MISTKLNSILYMDNDNDMRTLVHFAFHAIAEITVRPCSSTREMLNKAKEFYPDLLLLDAEMAGVDGLGMLHKLRKIPNTANTPAVFLTSKVQPDDISPYFSLGAIGFIPKPIDAWHALPERVMLMWEHRNRIMENSRQANRAQA